MLAESSALFHASFDGESPDAVGNFPPNAKKFAPWRLLVVDDEPLFRWAISETFGGLGYDIEEASDAESTVCALSGAGAGPDVVLLDLHLPDSTDLKLLETVHRMAPRAVIILMTAFGTPDVYAEAPRLGASLVLDKPFNVDELNDVVLRALAHPH
jgi:two-component system nitrogen regulation response regulator GlnG